MSNINSAQKNILLLNKRVGETPLQSINAFKKENSKYTNSKFAYAGRLDPMARGLLLVLVDDECKKRDKYQELNKTYEFKVILGISTDTQDVMGQHKKIDLKSKIEMNKIKSIINEFDGKYWDMKYPIYSSKTVLGKPLFWWARHSKFENIKIPQKRVLIKSLKYLNSEKKFLNEISSQIISDIYKVQGDFRQEEIIKMWVDLSIKYPNKELTILHLQSIVSSGTYIRALSDEIGNRLGLPAVAYDIFRTQIGEYKL